MRNVVDCGGGGTLAHACAQYGYTALIWAAQTGRANCARLLLDAGAAQEAKSKVRASAGLSGRSVVVWGGGEVRSMP